MYRVSHNSGDDVTAWCTAHRNGGDGEGGGRKSELPFRFFVHKSSSVEAGGGTSLPCVCVFPPDSNEIDTHQRCFVYCSSTQIELKRVRCVLFVLRVLFFLCRFFSFLLERKGIHTIQCPILLGWRGGILRPQVVNTSIPFSLAAVGSVWWPLSCGVM